MKILLLVILTMWVILSLEYVLNSFIEKDEDK